VLSATRESRQLRAAQDAGTLDCCAFEEDCFNCANYAPPASSPSSNLSIIALNDPDPLILIAAGSLVLPYHPPRV